MMLDPASLRRGVTALSSGRRGMVDDYNKGILENVILWYDGQKGDVEVGEVRCWGVSFLGGNSEGF